MKVVVVTKFLCITCDIINIRNGLILFDLPEMSFQWLCKLECTGRKTSKVVIEVLIKDRKYTYGVFFFVLLFFFFKNSSSSMPKGTNTMDTLDRFRKYINWCKVRAQNYNLHNTQLWQQHTRKNDERDNSLI